MSEQGEMERNISRLLRTKGIKRFADERNEPLFYWVLRIILPALAVSTAGSLFTDYCLKTSDSKTSIVVLAAVILVFMLLPILFAILKLISVTEMSNTFQVSFSRNDKAASDVNQGAFGYCSSVAIRATKSIYVVGPHFAPTGNPSTSQHDAYLETAMNHALARQSQYDPDRSFEGRQFFYFRIVQIDPSATDMEELVSEGRIPGSMIGNEPLRKHVAKALELGQKTEGSLDVKVWARPFIPSMPSILVIDERFIFFSLPTYASKGDTETPSLDYNFVFEVDDKSGNVARQFNKSS